MAWQRKKCSANQRAFRQPRLKLEMPVPARRAAQFARHEDGIARPSAPGARHGFARGGNGCRAGPRRIRRALGGSRSSQPPTMATLMDVVRGRPWPAIDFSRRGRGSNCRGQGEGDEARSSGVPPIGGDVAEGSRASAL